MSLEAYIISLETKFLVSVDYELEGETTHFFFTTPQGKITLARMIFNGEIEEVVEETERNKALWNVIFEVIKNDVRTIVKEYHHFYSDIVLTFFGQIEIYDSGKNLMDRCEIKYDRQIGYGLTAK